MKERRRSKRIKIKLPVRIRIFDKKMGYITQEIEACTENIGTQGLNLMIPLSWDCPECNNCLGWIYNLNCKLKNGEDAHDELRYLSPKFNFKISFFGIPPTNKQMYLEARCIWVKVVESSPSYYSVGTSLLRPQQKKISAYLTQLLSVAKKSNK